MYFLSARQSHHPLHLWLNADTIADVQNARVCMHVCTRGGGMCMVCCYNPEGLRLPAIRFCLGKMSHDKHMHVHLAFVHPRSRHNAPQRLQVQI